MDALIARLLVRPAELVKSLARQTTSVATVKQWVAPGGCASLAWIDQAAI
jgi:hypothetical protein